MSLRHQRFLERTALRTAMRTLRPDVAQGIPKEAFLRTRIQTIEPWMRVLLLIIGLLLWTMAVWLYLGYDVMVAAIFLSALGIVVVLIAVFGRKQTVDDALGAAAQVVFESLIS